MRPRKLLQRIAAGGHANVRFADLQRLAEACGFELQRVAGSHHIYVHAEIDAVLNLQDARGQAKPYQVRQFLRIVERYDLRPEDRS
jgi:predicted RNA binding protein YcfA (HicA-like mRNA interferase family)